MILRRFLPILCATRIWAAAPDGAELYKTRCGTCHDGKPQARMPLRDELVNKSPEFIFDTMFVGAMQIQAAGLSTDEGRAIARYITGKEFSVRAAETIPNQCTSPAPKFAINDGDWNGWGVDPGNSHYQSKSGLSAADIPKLKLKWAFGFARDPMAWAQPTVAGGRIFVGSVSGNVYSLDASTGCTYWRYNAGPGAGVRTAITIGKLSNGKWAAYFGDIRATAHAVDAETGDKLWTIKLDDHPVARITGAPILANGK